MIKRVGFRFNKEADLSKNGGSGVPFLAKYGSVLGLAILCLLFSILKPEVFPTYSNLISIINQISLLGIVAGGLTLVMIMGDFDLSIGATITLAGCLVASLLPHYSIFVSIVAAIGAGVLIGLTNGLIVAGLGISAFVATIAMMSILNGVTYWFTGGRTLFYGIPQSFINLAQGSLGPFPCLVLIMFFVLFILWVFLNQTPVGRFMQAIGGNKEAAKYSGINIFRNRVIGFIISGACAALVGVLLTARLSSAQPRAGDAYLMDAFAATFLGAATVKIGEFHIGGTLVGTLIMGVVLNGLTLLQVPYYFQYIFSGGILILAVALSGTANKN